MYNQFFTIKSRISEKKRRKQSCTPNKTALIDWENGPRAQNLTIDSTLYDDLLSSYTSLSPSL